MLSANEQEKLDSLLLNSVKFLDLLEVLNLEKKLPERTELNELKEDLPYFTELLDLLKCIDTKFNLNDKADYYYEESERSRIIKEVIEEINSLLNQDANPNIKDPVDNRTPLHLTGNIEVVKLLISFDADVYAQDLTGNIPLHHARNEEVAKLFITEITDKGMLNLQCCGGETPLHKARSTGISALLINAGADLNIKNDEGQTVLHTEDDKDVIKLLIAKKANLNIQDSQGNTPLHLAFQNKNKEKAKLLINAGARLDIQNKDGQTPLELAPSNEFADEVLTAIENDKKIKGTESHTPNTLITDNEKVTQLNSNSEEPNKEIANAARNNNNQIFL